MARKARTPTESGKKRFEVIFDRWKECRNAMFRCVETGDMDAYKIWAVRVDEINVLADLLFGESNKYLFDRKKRSHEYWLRTVGKAKLLFEAEESKGRVDDGD